MTRRQTLLSFLLFIAGFGLLSSQARAVTLDWAGVDWTAENLSQSFDIDASNPGNDITITITGNTNRFNANYPDDRTDINGSANTGGTGQEGLQLYVNSFTNRSQSVTVTISFNYTDGAYASFSLWDVDYGASQFQDFISNITGLTAGGATIGATSVTAGSAAVVAGSGTDITVTGTGASTNDSAGTVLIDFSTQRVTQISFTYGNGSGAPNNPGQQAIALSPIAFQPIPEAGTALGALACCGACILLARRRSRQTRIAWQS
jgi:hypothetical protein